MYFPAIQSDQLYTWSDENSKTVHRRIAKTPQRSPAPTASASSDPPRFSHRTLQTMRQAGMDYVPQESYAQTAEFLANYHRAREILEAICEINRELLRRREAL